MNTPPTSRVVLRATGLHKRFGDHAVLTGTDLEVKHGEVIVILGSSGSGKTTLIRSLNFLEMPDSGHVEVCGISVECETSARGKLERCSRGQRRQMALIRRNTAMVFQSFNLFPHLTALENVMEGPLSVQRVARDEARRRALRLLDRVALGDRGDAYPRHLSGGQQQRVAIARSLAMEPKVVFFDEPTSALDPQMRDEVLQVMKELADAGMTMLVVTHEMRFARDMADRVLFMDSGRIIHDSPADQFFKDANNDLRTRRFLGKLAV
ncbi:amino acid ABC transporter ATP-binding protein (plasmid) [Paraburkholderia strydomiana]